ncbi:MAG: Na/Pi cotransporter family protein [Candidatus Puniceispirillales bacterium]
MSATSIFINLIGSVALLLWGMRMVQTGIARALKERLHQFMRKNISNRFNALLVGAVVTVVLQSSTATGLIVSSFARRGVITIAMALALMLGADIGTTVVAQVLSFDVGWLSPLLLLTGVVTHQLSAETSGKQWGRVFIGLGLMLLALTLISTASQPLRDSSILLQIFTKLEHDWLLAILLMAVLTWLVHSSLAMVLLIMAIAGGGLVSPTMGLVLVLGANLGGIMPALVANWPKGQVARRVPASNALFKLCGVLIMLPLIGQVEMLMQAIEPSLQRQVVNFHAFFNIAIALIFLPLIGPVSRLMERLLPEETQSNGGDGPQHLDDENIGNPAVALASATLETIRMARTVEEMLRDGLTAIENRDVKLSRAVLDRDDEVDRLYEAIKLYVTQISGEELDKKESQRATNILTFTTDLEHIGDILGHLMTSNEKKIAADLEFSDEGFEEIQAMHMRVADGLTMAIGVFVSNDPKLAEQLLDEKRIVRQMEQDGAKSHMERLSQQRAESINTSALHMNVLRDLKRIHSHIVAIAYPVLEQRKKKK